MKCLRFASQEHLKDIFNSFRSENDTKRQILIFKMDTFSQHLHFSISTI